MAKPDPYADIDFEEINDQTNLANDEIKCLKVNSSSNKQRIFERQIFVHKFFLNMREESNQRKLDASVSLVLTKPMFLLRCLV